MAIGIIVSGCAVPVVECVGVYHFVLVRTVVLRTYYECYLLNALAGSFALERAVGCGTCGTVATACQCNGKLLFSSIVVCHDAFVVAASCKRHEACKHCT